MLVWFFRRQLAKFERTCGYNVTWMRKNIPLLGKAS
jgi:hypothetical protein